jgi:serine/threonine protein kinase
VNASRPFPLNWAKDQESHGASRGIAGPIGGSLFDLALGPGTRLGPYEILARIGIGAPGRCRVYRARDEALARTVALKVLPLPMSGDLDGLARFEREAGVLTALAHPNILTILDLQREKRMAFAVMELLKGETLRTRLAASALAPSQAAGYGVQICRALAAAHEKSLVHRDLTPENVFITTDGQPKVLNFGLAGVGQWGELSRPGNMERLAYVSPEEIRSGKLDHRSDIFSFGTILYEMVSGQRAFQGTSVLEIVRAIVTSDPPDLMETNRSLNPAFKHVLRHCLEKNPEQRFQSARDVASQLESFMGSSTGPGPGVH